MMVLTEKAFAKINLSLDVISRLDDGYHAMRMVMQSATLYDEITIKLTRDRRVYASCNYSFLPSDERNIAVKAAKLFFEMTGHDGFGAKISINKSIPVCAGLGGGSSDAAAVLRALNKMLETGLDHTELCRMGIKLGADVPFCVAGGTALAEGKGEALKDLPALPDCWIVLCKPAFSVSTFKLFAAINCEKLRNRPDTDGIIGELHNGCLRGVAMRMYNVFEDIMPKRFGEIKVIKRILLENGALGVSMSGTGPTVFGIFDDPSHARKSVSLLSAEYKECYIVNALKKIEYR